MRSVIGGGMGNWSTLYLSRAAVSLHEKGCFNWNFLWSINGGYTVNWGLLGSVVYPGLGIPGMVMFANEDRSAE